MENKCNKYEGLFIFQGKDALDSHIKECEECKKTHEHFMEISNLIKEAKPAFFREQRRKKNQLKTACAVFLLVLSGTFAVTINSDSNIKETLKYGDVLCAEDYGFPVDSFGLIMVDEWILKK